MNQGWKVECKEIVYVEQWLLNSVAFRDLSGTAMKALLGIRSKYILQKGGATEREELGWTVDKNKEVTFTYGEAKKKCGLSRSTCARVIDELVEKGFVNIIRAGTGVHREATIFTWSDRWQLYGTKNFQVEPRIKRRSYVFPLGKDHLNKVHQEEEIVQQDLFPQGENCKTVIYFLQAGNGTIKIGFTRRDLLNTRIEALRNMNATSIQLLGTLSGSRRDERYLHGRFIQEHLHSEWFTPSQRLMEYIHSLSL